MKNLFMAVCFSLSAAGAALGADASQIKQWQADVEKGDTAAMSQLARAYYSGDGVLKDYVKAFELFRKAADQGAAEGQNGMGFFHYSGLGGAKKDFAAAAAWYRKAAEQGLAKSQCNLAKMLQLGEGVAVNLPETVKWLRLSAEQGFANSQYLLGIALRDGSGTEKNAIEAWKWFSLAAEQKFENSAQHLASLEKWMLPDQLATAKKRAQNFPHPAVTKSGTGFFISLDGYLVTCFHVVEGSTKLEVKLDETTFPAQIVATDSANDLAILKVEGRFQPLPLKGGNTTQLGEAVFTVGFPNTSLQGLEPKFTRGEVSSLAGIKDDPRFWQVSVQVQPGNSGGPLVDQFGNAIGIVTSKLSDMAALRNTGSLPQNVNYALKVSYLNALLDNSPKTSGKVSVKTNLYSVSTDAIQRVRHSVALVLAN